MSNTLLQPRLLLDGWLGWPDPINWLVMFALISIRRQQFRVNQGIEVNFLFFYHLSVFCFEPWCTLAGVLLVCIPLLDSVVGGDKV